MPEMRYYTVRQEREVRVTATSAINAARIADAAFEGDGDVPIALGRALTEVRVRDIDVREDI